MAISFSDIAHLARHSPVAAYDWKDRGRAPPGYVAGMAVMYARLLRRLAQGDAVARDIARSAADTDGATDAVAWYRPEFAALGMDVTTAGADMLRHVFVLLTGLGMRESSGEYCDGRDMAADNVSADTAEAGLFQVSYNSLSASPLLPKLLTTYAGSDDLLAIFREGVACSAAALEDWGEGEGREFQRLSKACPAFAVEYAAVGLRHMRSHWGPLNRKDVELRPECDRLFRDVAAAVEHDALQA